MRKIIIITILLVLIACRAFSACTVDGLSYTAASANYTDVKACTDLVDTNSAYGATVNIPACAAGDCVWDTGIKITKDIRIVGAGTDATFLTNGMTANSSAYDAFFKFNPDAASRNNLDSLTGDTHVFEITGIHFYKSTTPVAAYVYGSWVYNLQPQVIKRIRVHHNKYTNISHALWAKGYVHGLFDNNTLVDTRAMLIEGYNSGHWTYDVRVPGTAQAFIIEDNVLTFPTISGNIFSSNNHGSSTVARYNTVNSGVNILYWETHCPASQFTEVYGNNFNTGASQQPQLRSGVGFVFFNKAESAYRVRHEYSDAYAWSIGINETPQASTCPGPTGYNPATGTFPQICNDFIDAGSDCLCAKVNHTYFWNNRNAAGSLQDAAKRDEYYDDSYQVDQGKTNTGVGVINPPELVENREFFNYTGSFDGKAAVGGTNGIGCGTAAQMNAITPTLVNAGFWVTSQNNCSNLTGYIGAHPATPISGTLYRWNGSAWVAYYTPYTYPHPLRGATTISGGVSISGGTIQ
jgi:hypothetical protein